MDATTLVINQTKKWLEKMVIGLNFCPFARKVFVQQKIRYSVTTSEKLFHSLIEEFNFLDQTPGIATTLLIIPDLTNFDSFLDSSYLAENLLRQMNYEGTYQIATFHPDYCFEGVIATDVTNYTNKSPHAILHLLREEDLEGVLDFYENPEEIPKRNIRVTQEMGLQKLHAILENCIKN
jgi:hypothetical protein